MELWLVLARFAHYGASLVLFGLVLFPFYAHGPVANRSADSRTAALSLPIAVLVLISGLPWFFGVVTSMTADKISWETARFVLAETSFGIEASSNPRSRRSQVVMRGFRTKKGGQGARLASKQVNLGG